MAKRATEVNRFTLEQAIKQAEANGPLANRGKLWEAVAEIYNKNSITPISHSVVYLRVQEWGLQVTTPVGKRGVSEMTPARIEAMQAARGARVPRGEKFANDPNAQKAFDELDKHTPERFKPLALKVRQGSKTTAMKLKCIECGNYSSVEIRECPVNDCPLWCFRPYQKNDEDADEVDTEETEATIGEPV